MATKKSKFDLTPEEEAEAAELKAKWEAIKKKGETGEQKLREFKEWWANSEEKAQLEADDEALNEEEKPIRIAADKRESYINGLVLTGGSSASWYRGNHNVKPAAWEFLKRHFKVSYLNQWEKERITNQLIENIKQRDEKLQALKKQLEPFQERRTALYKRQKELYSKPVNELEKNAGWQQHYDERRAKREYEQFIDKKKRLGKERRKEQSQKQNKKRQEVDWNELAKEFDELLPLLEL